MLSAGQYADLTALLSRHFQATPVTQGPLFTDRTGQCRLRERLYVPVGCVSSEHCDAFTYQVPIRYEIEEEVSSLDANGNPIYDEHGIEQMETVKRQCTVDHTLTTYDYFSHPDLGQCVGFLARDINKIIKLFGHLEIVDERVRVPIGIPYKFTGKLFKRQQHALKSFIEPNISGILKCPPGWGKTVYMMAYIAVQQLRTLVLIHDTALINQFINSARNTDLGFTNISELEEQYGQSLVGKLKYDRQTDTVQDYPITFMTYHLVVHNPRILDHIRDRFGLILIDECHHAAAANMDNILRNLNAQLTVGVTATVHRKDKFDVIFDDLIGPVRYIGKSDSDCHVVFKRGGSVSDRMSNMQNIIGKLALQEHRNRRICADIHERVMACAKSGILIEQVKQGLILEKAFRENYPTLRVGFYAASLHRPQDLEDYKSRINAPLMIKRLVKRESECVARAPKVLFQQYDQSLDPDEIVRLLQQMQCPDLLLERCMAIARNALDVFISTRRKFAEGLDMPMLSHISVVIPMAAPRDSKFKEGGVIEQIAGRTQRKILLADGSVNWNKPPSTMYYYVDEGPPILAGCKRSFENACRRVNFKITEERDDLNRQARAAMNSVL